MNFPISFTQYFVNKQNIRSFSNIINVSLFKSENEKKFFMHVFNDEVLVQEISPELWRIVIEFKENVKLLSKQDFRNYFVNDSTSHLSSIDKSIVFINCYNALRALIPKLIFGNNHNYKIFNKVTKSIIYSMKRQCFDYFELYGKWNFSCAPWSSLPKEMSSKMLICILFWIHRYLLSAMLSLNFYVTSCKLDNDDNKLHFFWKSQWQRFYDQAVSNMILNHTITKIHNIKNYSSLKASKNKYFKKDTPKLQLILKSKNNDYRAIVVYKRDSRKTEKYKIKERLNFLKVLTGPQSVKIETEYLKLHSNWVNQNYPKLYFIKTDLTNAFGSINKVKLLKILCEKYQKLQREEKSLVMKKKFALLYREFVNELRSPLVIRTGSAFYEWNKGLVQGYKYSPALSEVYYSYMDELYLSKYLQKTDNGLDLFLRVVDDYLYITDSLDNSHSFLKALTYYYNNVNYDKTVVNFQYENIQYCPNIMFLGYTYDTENMNVGRALNVYTGQMCYKIAFTTAIANIKKFIENRIGKSGIYISSHVFNFYYNSEALVWQHLFVTLCHCANKFCTILAIICSEKDMPKYLPIYKKKVTVNLCNSIIDILMKNKPNGFKFIYCINHFRYLSFRALLLCAKQTSKCNGLIPYLNTYLAKSNCMYGKWREHSSKITVEGENCMAVKEVCKRPDLKNIMREFNVLPEGFEGFKSISKNT